VAGDRGQAAPDGRRARRVDSRPPTPRRDSRGLNCGPPGQSSEISPDRGFSMKPT
jgi:hypothetical protein